MRVVRVAVVVMLAIVGVTNHAAAWDNAGHMQVADIAWTRLNDGAKAEVAAIMMAGDPHFRPASRSTEDVREAFLRWATFPDYIKFTKTTQYENMLEAMNRTFFVTRPPDPADNEDVRCKTWHYYDVPLHDSGFHPAKQSNALAAMAKARAEIARLQATPDRDRNMECWWLAWIEHLSGDLHQPLHCVSDYARLPAGDAGGNLFMIRNPGTTRPGRLHGYWDGGISRAIAGDKAAGISPNVEDVSQRWAQEFAPAAADVADLDTMSWIKSGASLAATIVYTGIEPDATPTRGYEQIQVALCKRQAVLAGARLAAILNIALGR